MNQITQPKSKYTLTNAPFPNSFLRGKSNLANRLDGLRPRDVSAPGTATIGRGPPNYQRMASCESRGSDKNDWLEAAHTLPPIRWVNATKLVV